MDFDALKAAVVASQVATLQTQIIMLTELGKNTNTSYTAAITAIQAQITKLNAL